MFDTKWYRARYQDVAASGKNPLVHYLRHGAAEGREPHPLFDSRQYRFSGAHRKSWAGQPLAAYLRDTSRPEFDAVIQRLQGAGMFDANYYRSLHNSAFENPFVDFLLNGEVQGALPYPGYSRPRTIGSLCARGVPMSGSLYVAFVQAQVAAFEDRVADDRRTQRATWITPIDMAIVSFEGPLEREYRATALASDRPARRWNFDREIASAVTTPFVAPGTWLRSLSIRVEGSEPVGARIGFDIAILPSGPSVTSGVATYDAETSSLVCDLEGAFEKGRRYFLRFTCNRETELGLRATAFYPTPLVERQTQPAANASVPSADAALSPFVAAKVAMSIPDSRQSENQYEPRAAEIHHVAVITIVYRRTDHLEAFLRAIFRQSYSGPMTVVFVDDCSPYDASVQIEQSIEQLMRRRPRSDVEQALCLPPSPVRGLGRG